MDTTDRNNDASFIMAIETHLGEMDDLIRAHRIAYPDGNVISLLSLHHQFAKRAIKLGKELLETGRNDLTMAEQFVTSFKPQLLFSRGDDASLPDMAPYYLELVIPSSISTRVTVDFDLVLCLGYKRAYSFVFSGHDGHSVIRIRGMINPSEDCDECKRLTEDAPISTFRISSKFVKATQNRCNVKVRGTVTVDQGVFRVDLVETDPHAGREESGR